MALNQNFKTEDNFKAWKTVRLECTESKWTAWRIQV